MQLLLNSPLQDGGWEVWLGGYITECAKAGEWRVTGEPANEMVKPIQVVMFQEIDTPAGKRCVPTERLCRFVQEKFAIYTK